MPVKGVMKSGGDAALRQSRCNQHIRKVREKSQPNTTYMQIMLSMY